MRRANGGVVTPCDKSRAVRARPGGIPEPHPGLTAPNGAKPARIQRLPGFRTTPRPPIAAADRLRTLHSPGILHQDAGLLHNRYSSPSTPASTAGPEMPLSLLSRA